MVKLGSEIIDLQGANNSNIFHATLPIDGTLDSWADHSAQYRWPKGPHISRNKPKEDMIAY